VTKETRKVWDLSTSVTDYIYDPANGDLLSMTVAVGRPYAATTTYVWTNGLLQFVNRPDQSQRIYSYDANRRLTDETWLNPPSQGQTTADYKHTTYNQYGDVATVTDNEGNKTVFGAHPRGFTPWQEIREPNNQLTARYEFSYHPSGLPTETKDGQNNIVRNDYDQVGRVTFEKVLKPDGQTVVSIKQNNYDAANRLTSQIVGATSKTVYTYRSFAATKVLTACLEQVAGCGVLLLRGVLAWGRGNQRPQFPPPPLLPSSLFARWLPDATATHHRHVHALDTGIPFAMAA
jgi:hypothetical protein